MTKLKLGAIPDDKPVKLSIELPADVHRDLLELLFAQRRVAKVVGHVEDAEQLHVPLQVQKKQPEIAPLSPLPTTAATPRTAEADAVAPLVAAAGAPAVDAAARPLERMSSLARCGAGLLPSGDVCPPDDPCRAPEPAILRPSSLPPPHCFVSIS